MSSHGYGYCYDESSFFVFESTGDSEVDVRPAYERGTVALEEDDAESCSYDDLGSELDLEEECREDKVEDAEEEEKEEEEEGVKRDGGGRLGGYKSCVSAESKGGGRDFMNEMERNKLFWEACLAS